MVRLWKTVQICTTAFSHLPDHSATFHPRRRWSNGINALVHGKRKGCLATYSICLWPLLQSHWLGGVGNAAEYGQVGGIHALSSSRQEHRYLLGGGILLDVSHLGRICKQSLDKVKKAYQTSPGGFYSQLTQKLPCHHETTNI